MVLLITLDVAIFAINYLIVKNRVHALCAILVFTLIVLLEILISNFGDQGLSSPHLLTPMILTTFLQFLLLFQVNLFLTLINALWGKGIKYISIRSKRVSIILFCITVVIQFLILRK